MNGLDLQTGRTVGRFFWVTGVARWEISGSGLARWHISGSRLTRWQMSGGADQLEDICRQAATGSMATLFAVAAGAVRGHLLPR